MIKTVAIVGGTHGNELTGIKLIEHWQSHPELISHSSIKTKVLLGNLLAIQKKIRCLDEDLNRTGSCFLSDEICAQPDTSTTFCGRIGLS